ncbi:MAG: hypothetical protein Q4D25_12185 [Bacteroidales bacterium]|nr:hypothetical protein [Bacteroidales bacterium]
MEKRNGSHLWVLIYGRSFPMGGEADTGIVIHQEERLSASVLYTRKFSRFTDGRSLVLPRLSPTPA